MNRRMFIRFLPLWAIGAKVTIRTFAAALLGLLFAERGEAAGPGHVRMVGGEDQDVTSSKTSCRSTEMSGGIPQGCSNLARRTDGDNCTDTILKNLCESETQINNCQTGAQVDRCISEDQINKCRNTTQHGNCNIQSQWNRCENQAHYDKCSSTRRGGRFEPCSTKIFRRDLTPSPGTERTTGGRAERPDSTSTLWTRDLSTARRRWCSSVSME